jgi:3'-phosphoadenosine 5'-phosphosulfate sulfotransferase (PAPS reductase)/FAD synthetase
MNDSLEASVAHKIANAIFLLKISVELKETIVSHSGGKDSVLIHWLMQQAFPDDNFLLVHTPKAETHPETKQFIYDCASKYAMLFVHSDVSADFFYKKTSIDGTRRAEWSRTDGRSTHYVSGGKEFSREDMPEVVEDGLFGAKMVYPILHWSDEEVWHCIHSRNIPFSSEYQEQSLLRAVESIPYSKESPL